MNDKNFKILYFFAAYVLIMGITGFLRTSATMPLYLNGSIALITTIFAYMFYTKRFVLVLRGAGFGSMAVFSGLTFVLVCKKRKNETEKTK